MKYQFIISREGASSVSELKVVGKPCILVPFLSHRDQHQVYNAQNLRDDVDFPVLVTNADELRMNDFRKLKEFLEYIQNHPDYDFTLIEEGDGI